LRGAKASDDITSSEVLNHGNKKWNLAQISGCSQNRSY